MNLMVNRKLVTIAVLMASAALVAPGAWAGGAATIELNEGDSVYACACGEECPCQMLSRKAGQCGCGNDLVQATVQSVGDGDVVLESDAWDGARTFKTTGAYHCACGESCGCDTISQKAGRCSCGHELAKVGA